GQEKMKGCRIALIIGSQLYVITEMEIAFLKGGAWKESSRFADAFSGAVWCLSYRRVPQETDFFRFPQQSCSLCMPANQWHGFNLWEGKSGQDPLSITTLPTVRRVAWKCTGWHGDGGWKEQEEKITARGRSKGERVEEQAEILGDPRPLVELNPCHVNDKSSDVSWTPRTLTAGLNFYKQYKNIYRGANPAYCKSKRF
ncbi:unnamed protein product, partial [Arctogadus glacialis]